MIRVLLHGFRSELVRLDRLPVLLVHYRLTVLILVVICAASALHEYVILKAADLVDLQRVVFDLSLIVIHVDHFIATIFDGVILLVVIVWHHVLEILVRICVHILFFSLIRISVELLLAFKRFFRYFISVDFVVVSQRYHLHTPLFIVFESND